MSALVGIFQGRDTSQIPNMARPGGNPNLLTVRNTDTAAANLARQERADKQALEVFDWVLAAINDGCGDKREWMNWLNAHGYHTRGKNPRPWSRKTFQRVLYRLGRRKLLSPAQLKLLKP